MGSGFQLMHAGEEALFGLIPLAVVLLLDPREGRARTERIEAIKRTPPAEQDTRDPAGAQEP